ncbi:MAG TPA: hypothetical protein VEI02_14675, partial [Planctomycetota bacterium]|nr:hypothetical protein [Planctomycetota bacterium]
AAGAVGARPWPSAADPRFDPADNPAVARDGDRLAFDPPRRWTGRLRDGDRAAVLTPESLPASDAAPRTWTLAADGVAYVDARGRASRRSPAEYERLARAAVALEATLIATGSALLLFLAARLLAAVRGVRASAAPAARATARALAPAGLAALAGGVVSRWTGPAALPYVLFLAVAGAALLLALLDGAPRAAAPSSKADP